MHECNQECYYLLPSNARCKDEDFGQIMNAYMAAKEKEYRIQHGLAVSSLTKEPYLDSGEAACDGLQFVNSKTSTSGAFSPNPVSSGASILILCMMLNFLYLW